MDGAELPADNQALRISAGVGYTGVQLEQKRGSDVSWIEL